MNVMAENPSWTAGAVLDATNGPPALASDGAILYLYYTDSENNLKYYYTRNGDKWTGGTTDLQATSRPALTFFQGVWYLAYCGKDQCLHGAYSLDGANWETLAGIPSNTETPHGPGLCGYETDAGQPMLCISYQTTGQGISILSGAAVAAGTNAHPSSAPPPAMDQVDNANEAEKMVTDL